MKSAWHILFIAAVSFGAVAAGTVWNVEADKARVTFKIKGPLGIVEGSFSGLQADIVFDKDKPESCSIAASIDANTVKTGIKLRDSDLKREKVWFDTKKYPRISFKSTQFQKTSSGYSVKGDLTMKGVTRPVTIFFTFIDKGEKGVFKGGFSINRDEFGLSKSGFVGKEVSILLEVPVKK